MRKWVVGKHALGLIGAGGITGGVSLFLSDLLA
jgi:hypothetical protein